MKRHVAELIDKIEKLCNEGHQTDNVSVHIPSTHEREGLSSHTIGQPRTRRLLSVDEDKWNALVHAARIPPQRRMATPFPSIKKVLKTSGTTQE
ncbi:hypothetical protein DEO72_LG11g3974 [Vigna unguiculata]|uniref:Uncharacterized protein n=1 Tax=Vigna unguiculata TaxID=3917 RepID=A0A4D6NWY6_VIGUN|nr:hypothetical protein DEO72_LG11g3974 [Vigna unguiculata]